MTERFQSMLDWLHRVPLLRDAGFEPPEPASSDASFRRYYRIKPLGKGTLPPAMSMLDTLIVMDAPPEHEDCRPFVKVAKQMASYGLNVPHVLAQDLDQGFLLLSDLGSQTFLADLNADTVEKRYYEALTSLVTLQAAGGDDARQLPHYDESLLEREMNLFSEWLCGTHLELRMNSQEQSMWGDVQQTLTKAALAQPKVYVHRDYHSRNLMVSDTPHPGILDFQDAVYGPLTYDAVSLLRDCYIRWPFEQVREWQREYFWMLVEKGLVSRNEWEGFVQSMDWMGMQRHLKAAGIFARLYHRDGKDGYLGDLPRTLGYLCEVGQQYKSFWAFSDWVQARVLDPLNELSATKG